MSVRLRPQSSAWMAPHALAAQLQAQTGQIAGQGVAGLLGGIAQGVGAFTQKREQRRAEAINESRYQDSLMRQDRSFQYGAAQDQANLLAEYLKGAETEVALSAMSSPTGAPDPSKVQNLRTAQSSMSALRSQLAKIGGVQPAVVPEMPAAPAAPALHGDDPRAQAELRASRGYEGLSDEELMTVATGLASEAETLKSEMDAMVRIGGAKGAAAAASKRTAYAEKSREARIAEFVLSRRQREADIASKRAEREASAAADVEAYKEKRGVDAGQDREAVAALQADLDRRGIKTTLPGDLPSARALHKDLLITDPNSEVAAARKAAAAKEREDARARRDAAAMAGRERVAGIAAAQKDRALAAKAVQDAIDNQEAVVRSSFKEYETLKKMQEKGLVGDDDPDLRAAFGKYADARDVYAGMLESVPQAPQAQAPVTPGAAPTPGAVPAETSEERLRRIFGR